MRGVTVWLVIILLSSTAASQEGTVNTVQNANAAYEDGDYLTAITLYEALVIDGVRDAVVYFNLGSAYYESGQLGLALLNYRRAQQITPRDTEVSRSIARIRSERIDLQHGEAALVDYLASSTRSILTLSELSYRVFSIWTLWFGLATAYILRPTWRSPLHWTMVAGSVLLLVSLILLSSRQYVDHQRPAAVVIALSAPVMSGPGETYLPLYQLYAAAELRVLEARDGWAHFVLPDGRQGWIKQSIIETI